MNARLDAVWPALSPGEGVFFGTALLLVGGVLLGIKWLKSPRTAVRGNLLSAVCMGGFILLTIGRQGLWSSPPVWLALGSGVAAGLAVGWRARMIRMPELVALFNGLGGAASAVVAALALPVAVRAGAGAGRMMAFLGLAVGSATLGGSLVAAAKLSRLLSQRPTRFKGQQAACMALLPALAALALAGTLFPFPSAGVVLAVGALAFGTLVVLRVGGADMPVTISLLNALSGVAACLAGFALGHPVLVAVGGLVGAAGLMLTRVMCRAMNRRLADILTGRTAAVKQDLRPQTGDRPRAAPAAPVADPFAAAADWLREASRIVLIPGYGMAVAQAQGAVARLFRKLQQEGKEVCFAIHPVAGRMPGHMHVLLAEADLPYECFRELEDINPEFPAVDLAVIIGANDVVNPAANTARDTPIYGLPVLDAEKARRVIVCNLDDGPGYAGVANPLYQQPQTLLLLGDARQTIERLAGKEVAGKEVDGGRGCGSC